MRTAIWRQMLPEPTRRAGRRADWIARGLGPARARRADAPEGVAIYHTGRCGSTVVGDLLRQDSRFRWLGEGLGVWDSVPWARRMLPVGDPVRGHLRRVVARLRTQHPVLSVKQAHVRRLGWSFDEVVPVFAELGLTRGIIVERKNLLRIIVSAAVGRARGRWHVPEGERATLTRVRLEPSAVLGELEELHRTFRDLARIGAARGWLHLTYEEHIEPGPERAYRLLCESLSLEPLEVQVRLARTTPFRLAEVVENMAEVAEALRGTRFEPMVEDEIDSIDH